MAQKTKPKNSPKSDKVLENPTDAPVAQQPSSEAPQDTRSESHQPSPGGGFPIVGIGASAGGLSAFEVFFSGLPANTDPGLAFVLVQHLAPDHKSILTDLIRRYTRLQVYEVEDGMVVRLKHVQEPLRQSQQKFASIFEKASFAATVSTLPGGVIVDVNESFERIFGYTRRELIRRSSQEWGLNPTQIAELLQDGSITEAEIELRTKSGEVRTFLNSINVIEISDQKHALSVLQDITERKRVEESLRESESRLAREVDALAQLHKLATFSLDGADLRPILAEIVDVAIAISGADFGNIQLLDPASSDLRIVGQRGLPRWWLDYWERVAKGQGTCGTALEGGQRIIVEDVEQSPIFAGTPGLEMQRRAAIRACQSTPLVSLSGTPLGMISTHYKNPRKPDDHALRLLDLLARQAADIIDRARLQGSLGKSEDRFRALAGAGRDDGRGASERRP